MKSDYQETLSSAAASVLGVFPGWIDTAPSKSETKQMRQRHQLEAAAPQGTNNNRSAERTRSDESVSEI